MMACASAIERSCAGSAGACARLAPPSASAKNGAKIKTARDDACRSTFIVVLPSFLRLLEISQIRRRLVLLGGHQEAIRAQHVALLADDEMRVVLGTRHLDPVGLRVAWIPAVRPGARAKGG